MLPEYMGNSTPTTFLNYDDIDLTNSSDYYNLFDNGTDGMYNWMGNLTDTNATMLDGNVTRRFKRDYDYDDEDNNASNEIREANFYNAISDFYANLQDGTSVATSLDGNASDFYATISTIIDNITSTSTSTDDENITDYERK